jgi:hypothetical protein
LVLAVLKDPLVLRDLKAFKVLWVLKEIKETKENLDQPDLWDYKVFRDLLDRQAHVLVAVWTVILPLSASTFAW